MGDKEEKKLDVDNVLPLLFEEFERDKQKLKVIPEQANTKIDSLLKLFENDIFTKENQTNFLSILKSLNIETGHAYHIVQQFELARLQAQPPKIESLIPTFSQPQQSQSPINISTQTPSLGWLSGLWYYKGEKEKAQALTAMAEARRSDVPQISTSKEVIDTLDFGRQLTPEFNRVIEYFNKAVAITHDFSDPDTKERLQSDMRMHLNKLSGIILAFCEFITGYRTDLVGDRERDVAKAILALKMAESGFQTRILPGGVGPTINPNYVQPRGA